MSFDTHHQHSRENSWKQATDNFLAASYPQRPRSQLSLQSSKPPSLNRSFSESEVYKRQHVLAELKKQGTKEVILHKEDHTLRRILYATIIFLLIIFAIDMRNYIARERHRLQLEAKHCQTEYIENQCDNAVEVMKQECKQLHACYTTPPEHKLQISQLAVKLLGNAVDSLIQSAGIIGTFFLLCLVCLVLFFMYKSSRGTVVIKQKHN